VPVPQPIQQTIDLSNRGIIVNWRCQSWCPSAGSVGTLARTASPLFAVKQLIPNSRQALSMARFSCNPLLA
jgi:hypothetical protein